MAQIQDEEEWFAVSARSITREALKGDLIYGFVERVVEEYIIQRARQYGITWQDVLNRLG